MAHTERRHRTSVRTRSSRHRLEDAERCIRALRRGRAAARAARAQCSRAHAAAQRPTARRAGTVSAQEREPLAALLEALERDVLANCELELLERRGLERDRHQHVEDCNP